MALVTHGARGGGGLVRWLREPVKDQRGKGPQATPVGRNCTLTRGPTGFAVLGMQCSQVR